VSATRNRRRSREGREIRTPRPSRIFRYTIFSSSLEINYLGEGRGDLQSATFSTACFRGGFSRIFEGRGLCSESPARPSAGRNPEGVQLKGRVGEEVQRVSWACWYHAAPRRGVPLTLALGRHTGALHIAIIGGLAAQLIGCGLLAL
jgi:hypothetical protein